MKKMILSLLALLVTAATGAWAQSTTTHKVTMKSGTKDADKWTAKAGDATTFGELPLEGVAEGQTVTLQYDGRLKVKSITAKVTAPAAAPVEGKFTINADGDQVNFAPGNLQATTTDKGANWTWAFAEHQWDFIGNDVANTKINGNGTVSENGTVDLFGWVGASSTWTGAAQYGISNSDATENTDGYGNVAPESLKSDWGNTMGTGWRTLARIEWGYVFDTRTTGGTVGETAQARYAKATINTDVNDGVNGIILFPDGVDIANTTDYFTTLGNINNTSDWGTKCTSAQWTALAAKGCVFLPAAGYRVGDSVNKAGTLGSYWSSSPRTANVEKTHILAFNSSGLNAQTSAERNYGRSVRLVKAAE